MAPPAAPAPLAPGRVLGGRYRLVTPVAKGGMAEVWEGYDEVLSRSVAVKVLKDHLAQDQAFLLRFRQEARTAAALSHPGIVSTYDTGMDSGTAYIVMELIRGQTLRELLERGPLPVPLAVSIAAQIADGLASAHKAGLVHRDVKPANVLLADDGWGSPRVKVTDFGIAKATAGLGQDLTSTGMVLGTPKYLSPEQIQGLEPDARADLYGLGVVLYEMLAGTPPFVGKTDMATALAHLNEEPVPIGRIRRDLPPGLERIVNDLLAKDPQRRVPSAVALRQALVRISTAPPPSGPPGPAPSGAGRAPPSGGPAQARIPPGPGGTPINHQGQRPDQGSGSGVGPSQGSGSGQGSVEGRVRVRGRGRRPDRGWRRGRRRVRAGRPPGQQQARPRLPECPPAACPPEAPSPAAWVPPPASVRPAGCRPVPEGRTELGVTARPLATPARLAPHRRLGAGPERGVEVSGYWPPGLPSRSLSSPASCWCT